MAPGVCRMPSPQFCEGIVTAEVAGLFVVRVDGFEGDAVAEGPQAGQRLLNGWKNAGLPWTYKLDKNKMYLPGY